MRTIIPAIVAGLVISFSAPAFAGDASATTTQPVAVAPPATAQAAAATTQPASEKRICKDMAHEGMLVKTNVCKTQQEWDDIRHRQQHEVADFQNRNFQTSSGK